MSADLFALIVGLAFTAGVLLGMSVGTDRPQHPSESAIEDSAWTTFTQMLDAAWDTKRAGAERRAHVIHFPKRPDGDAA